MIAEIGFIFYLFLSIQIYIKMLTKLKNLIERIIFHLSMLFGAYFHFVKLLLTLYSLYC